jgi:hypothetical protein
MRVGSASEIHQLFMPRTKSVERSEGPEEQTAAPSQFSGLAPASDESMSAFLAVLAQGNFDRDDTNRDGFVSRDEYVENKMERRPDGYQPQLEDVLRTWSELGGEGRGELSEQEFKEAFSSIFR